MSRYKITVEYDGTGLLGWQRQLDGLSVQECLETALFQFSGVKTELYASGRTDAGVHAFEQVVHFDLDTKLDEYRIREAFNAILRFMGAKIAVLNVEIVADDFNARFDAKRRSYIYKILNRKAPSPLNANRSWHVSHTLDINKMIAGSKHLLGNHDFSSFRAAACQAKSPIKTLDKIDITQQGDEIYFYLEARSFLHHQVRNIVGTLKMVGDGSILADNIPSILDAKDRSSAGITAPAHGLYLYKVWY